MVNRVLITTSIESTWPDNSQPVLFLGEACKLYSRKHVWQNLDAETVPYHWDDRSKFQNDYLYLQRFYEEILVELSEALNKVHNTNYSIRYWRIYAGIWLGYFIQMLFDRWTMLNKAVSEYKISEVPVIDADERQFIPNDAMHFQHLYLSDEWNEVIYQSILKLMPSAPPLRHVISPTDSVPSQHTGSLNKSGFTRETLLKAIDKISGWFVRSNEGFFLSSYLPYRIIVGLQFRLRQVPKFWRAVSTPIIDLQTERKHFSLRGSSGNEFESIVRMLIPRFIPRVYLEGYGMVQKTISGLAWPQKPSFIFTANAYSNDDVFKAWAAKNTETGSRLIIAQHGGYFGLGAFGFIEDHQIAISDTYISWGWKDPYKLNVRPFANLLIMNRSARWDPNGDILLVNMSIPRYSYHLLAFPQSSQYLKYFNDQVSFGRSLSDGAREVLLVRPCSQDFGWDQRSRWADELPDVKLDEKGEPFQKALTRARLVVASYNATTFLETLSLNVPTIIFWDPVYWELKPEAETFFEKLEKAGIFHRSPEAAAAKVSEIYQNVQEWWQQKEIQEIRIQFCSKYSNCIEKPVRSLKAILNQEAGN